MEGRDGARVHVLQTVEVGGAVREAAVAPGVARPGGREALAGDDRSVQARPGTARRQRAVHVEAEVVHLGAGLPPEVHRTVRGPRVERHQRHRGGDEELVPANVPAGRVSNDSARSAGPGRPDLVVDIRREASGERGRLPAPVGPLGIQEGILGDAAGQDVQVRGGSELDPRAGTILQAGDPHSVPQAAVVAGQVLGQVVPAGDAHVGPRDQLLRGSEGSVRNPESISSAVIKRRGGRDGHVGGVDARGDGESLGRPAPAVGEEERVPRADTAGRLSLKVTFVSPRLTKA